MGRWPRYLTLSPDGKRLAVWANADGGVSVVDTAARKMLFQENFACLNFGQMHTSHDGKYVYFPWTVYRLNPITPSNIREGWVLATRIARVRLDEKLRREAISLDRSEGGLRSLRRARDGSEESWTVLGASRGEAGILGEGVRQALLRDPTYQPALACAKAFVS